VAPGDRVNRGTILGMVQCLVQQGTVITGHGGHKYSERPRLPIPPIERPASESSTRRMTNRGLLISCSGVAIHVDQHAI
jgi:hypothetical protein